MVGSDTLDPQTTQSIDTSIDAGTTFFNALFSESDTVLFRPIEAWTENGKKRSRVDYRNSRYRPAQPFILKNILRQQLLTAERELTNLFFGVCPRFGDGARYDLAWQIRTVRALWADVDHATVGDVRDRIAKSGFPQSSITVNSGNGVHLYWLLDEPFLIDDVGPPPPVLTEWIETRGKKKPLKYVIEDGERFNLPSTRFRLSPKAESLESILAGIAKAIDGDHTTDLARLLRIPGSLNRKDERNGKEPLATTMVECVPDRRYAISVFEPWKVESETVQRRHKLEKMPLPKIRKPTPSQSNRLSDLIATSAIAPAGQRSEADFAVCCFAIRKGVSKDEIWSQVSEVGKFAESGEQYFDLTWSNAEYEVKSKKVDELERSYLPERTIAGSTPHASAGSDEPNSSSSANRPIIYIEPESTPVAETLCSITDHLLSAGDCFTRAQQLVVVHSEQIEAILSTAELSGLLNQHVEFYLVAEKGGGFKPIPTAYSSTWLNKRSELHRMPAITSFVRNPVYNQQWELVKPGYDKTSGIYYAGPEIQPTAITGKLDALLDGFCFKTPGDRTNFIGMLVTAILIPHFIGSKPALLLCANQPELGKTILAQIISILRDGCAADTASYNPNDEEFEKRLGAVVRRGATTIIVDNAKSYGRNPRIDSACLERSITDAVLSFRLLGQSSTIRAENSHIFCITANSPEVSRDLVTRSVVVNLYYEGDPAHRKFSIDDPEGFALDNRTEILGELLTMVEKWKQAGQPRAVTSTRFNKRGWGNIVGGILEVAREPDFLLNASDAAEQLDETKREFTELVTVLVDHPQGTWTAAELASLCDSNALLKQDLGDGSPRSRSTRMGTLSGRYVNEHFLLDDGRQALFKARDARKGKTYLVSVTESAEP